MRIVDVLFLWENRWKAKPLTTVPLKKASMFFSSIALVVSAICIIYFASVAGQKHIFTFLAVQYWVHLVISVGILSCSISTMLAVCISPHGVAGSIRCPGGRISLVLVFSRVLRALFWIALLTFSTVIFSGKEACSNIDERDVQEVEALMCRCITGGEADGVGSRMLTQLCKPRSFETCVSTSGSNHSGCSSFCEVSGKCTESSCVNLEVFGGCKWGQYECPPRVEQYTLQLAHRFSYCHYDWQGKLTTTNMAPPAVGQSEIATEISHELSDTVVSIDRGTGGRSAFSDSDWFREANVCTFVQGDGTCDPGKGCSEMMVAGWVEGSGTSVSNPLRYVGPGCYEAGGCTGVPGEGRPYGGIYPRKSPDNRTGLWTEQACAEYVIEHFPTANGATYSGLTNEKGQILAFPQCFAEFGMERSDNDEAVAWRTCQLEPTGNLQWTTFFLAGTNISLPASCRMEMETYQARHDRQVLICQELVDGFLVFFLLFLCVTSYHAAKVLYNFHLSTSKTSVAGIGGAEGNHVELKEPGDSGPTDEPDRAHRP